MTPDLATELRSRIAHRPRFLLGITGAPGAGKSTLAASLALAVPGAVVVPMDGFHRTTAQLDDLGWVDERGTARTFDADAYVELLRRLRAGATVSAPAFDRSIEEPVSDAITVPATANLIITEGNYLLLDDEPWSAVADLLDEVWFLDVDEEVRVRRLIDRHVEFGRSRVDAEYRVRHGVDAGNARLVRATRGRATRVLSTAS